MIVAVDGYSSTGKSTVAKLIAAKLGLTYIDTGAMYRAVTLAAMREGLIADGVIDREKLREVLKGIKIGFKYNRILDRYETYLNGEYVEEQIRGMEVSDRVSGIAALDFVREFLVDRQREMGREEDVIMDGRDIGTVVFPQADVKFFMTASPEVRAQRRYRELQNKGVEVSYEEVEANVRKRDYIDSHREVSPLVQAEDAIVIDNGDMTIAEEVEQMVREIRRMSGGIA
ncbi:(d)CMP kinase [Lactobacillus taiwanensis]|uniref:(d)CMP kinase n=1 Tax=Lactobacillus taiwanensis TaxID=508451 RepID=UPI00272C6297|nr:(d)CMP kinase [Lactobacillus taiwanensis]